MSTPLPGPLPTHVPSEAAGRRLDQLLVGLLPVFSRSRLQGWIRDGAVRLGGVPVTTPGHCLRGGERLSLTPPPPAPPLQPVSPPPLRILYEDEQLLVLDKPPGLVVHPGAGRPHGTLLDALLHYLPGNRDLPQGGLLQRLDKDTSGVLVAAKTPAAHAFLGRRIRLHRVRREYRALVDGVPVAGGRVEAPLGRHPRRRRRRAVTSDGRSALSHYRVLERFRCHSLLRLWLGSGRTHQLRVHLAHLGYPVAGDALYGRGAGHPPGSREAPAAALATFGRQALHACRLELEHPAHGCEMLFRSPLAPDFRRLLELLRKDAADA